MKSLSVLVACTLLGCGVAQASRPCPPASTECLAQQHEEMVYFAAYAVAVKNVCSQINPALADRYEQSLSRMAEGDRERFNALLKAPQFPVALERSEAELRTMKPAQLQRDCEDLLRQ